MAVSATGVVVGLAVVALLLWVILLYNRLVSLENATERAWANVDVILKQRNDEVPNLVVAVKGYAAHERALFDGVAQARSALAGRAPRDEKAVASAEMSEHVHRLFAVAEAYPDLKANESYLALQRRLSGLEDLLADRREFYNQSVMLFNTRIREIPDVWVARGMKLKPKVYFEADPGDALAPSL